MTTKSLSVIEVLHILIFFLILHTIILPCLCSHMVYSLYFKQKDHSNITDEDPEEVLAPAYPDLEDKVESDIVIVMMTSKGRQNYRQRTLMSVFREVSSMPERYKFFVCTGDSEGLVDENIYHKSNMKILEPCKDKRLIMSTFV